MPTIIKVSCGTYRPIRAPRLTAIDAREMIWNRFGRVCHVRTKGRTLMIYLSEPKIINDVARILEPFDEHHTLPDAQRIIITTQPCPNSAQ